MLYTLVSHAIVLRSNLNRLDLMSEVKHCRCKHLLSPSIFYPVLHLLDPNVVTHYGDILNLR